LSLISVDVLLLFRANWDAYHPSIGYVMNL
jgi:hypothetical protein